MQMNRNLFIMELRKNLSSLIVWTVIISLLISLTMSVFKTFVENQSDIMGMMNLVPKGALQFKGISNFDDLLSVLGFYAANNVIYMMLLGSIFATVLGSNILLKEEYNKTAEYLLTRPLTRSEIFFSKLYVLLLYVFLINLLTSLTGLSCMKIVQDESFSTKAFFILSLYTFLLNILFGAIGLFLSVMVRRPKPITTFSIGLVLIFYFVYTLSKITESAEKIGYLSPFKFVRTDVINPDYKLDLLSLIYFIGLTLFLLILSHRLYLRKDIYT
jgi:ABC-2 type transport system permease protein